MLEHIEEIADIQRKEEMVFKILLSLNAGNSGDEDDRVRAAIKQYNQLTAYFDKEHSSEL